MLCVLRAPPILFSMTHLICGLDILVSSFLELILERWQFKSHWYCRWCGHCGWL